MLRTELIRPLPELLREHAVRRADRIAYTDGRRSVTYARLEVRTRRVAGHLAGLGLQPGDRALICLGNRVENVESYFALARASAMAVPVSPGSTDAELSYLLEDSGARLVITDHARAARFRRLRERHPGLRIVLVGGGTPPPHCVAYEVLAAAEPGTAARDDLGLDEPAWIVYTAGTTGKPKGVVSTQRNCLWSVAACYVPIPGLSADDRVLWPLPLCHSFSHIVCVLAVAAVGATARIVEGYESPELPAAMREFRPSVLAGVPTTYHRLLAAGGGAAAGLRMGLVGGAVLPAGLRRSFEDRFEVPLIDAYGSTETCGAVAMNWPSGGRVEGSCGLPVPGVAVRLVDVVSGEDVPAGREGEVWVRGPNVMAGYHNQPAATAVVLADGWYRTGDLARSDESGFLTVTGRVTELIIRAGENIHPGEVEDVLHGVAGVADVAVAGKPHEALGEVPVAYVVPGPGGFDPAELLAVCHEQLSYAKVPEEVYEIAAIPRTAGGKITRHVLLEAPARLRSIGSGHYESLLRLDWIPRSRPFAPPAPTGSWAVAGSGVGVPARAYGSLAEVRAAVAAGEPVPDVTLLAPPEIGETAAVARAVAAGVRALVAELDAWLVDDRLAGARLVVITRGAVATGEREDVADLRRAPLWGVLRSVQAAHPGRIRVVDVEPDTPGAALVHAATGPDTQSAVRSGVVLVPRLARVAVPAEPEPVAELRGTVLVAGADGVRGTAIARHLATAYGVRRLLLISADGWPEPAAAELTAAFAAVGAEAVLETGVAADRTTLEALLAREDRPLAGVVNAEEPSSRHPVEAVVRGIVTLHELTRDTGAWFVLVSSPCGVLGAAGRAEQAAVDAFGTALVRRRRFRGLPGLALAWGPLAEEGRSGFPGVAPMSTVDALAMTDAALAAGQGSLAVLRTDPVDLRAPVIPVVLHDLIDLSPEEK
jgi:acyl-CoA synthetase (AMP-forming)/AMP-acid ligase II